MQNYYNGFYDFQTLGDRRKAERRQQPFGRRGILRWDPTMKDRRMGKDQRRLSAVIPGR